MRVGVGEPHKSTVIHHIAIFLRADGVVQGPTNAKHREKRTTDIAERVRVPARVRDSRKPRHLF